VFPGPGKVGHFVGPRKPWARILKRAGLKDLRLHDLRRTLGSWQAMLGSSLLTIGASLGHRDLNTTAVYARLNLDPVRKSVESAVAAIAKAGNFELPAAEEQ
jgi:integrase